MLFSQDHSQAFGRPSNPAAVPWDGLLTAHGSLSASDSSRLTSRSPWHNLTRLWPLSLVQLYAMEMSNESFEVCPSTFISLSLLTLLHKLILYLLCRSCSSVPFGTFPQQERKVVFTGAVDSKADLTLPGRQKETAEVTSTSTPQSSPTFNFPFQRADGICLQQCSMSFSRSLLSAHGVPGPVPGTGKEEEGVLAQPTRNSFAVLEAIYE